MYGSIHTHFESRYDTTNDLKQMCLNFIRMGAKHVAVTEHGVFSSYEDLRDVVEKIRHDVQDGKITDIDPNFEFSIEPGIEGYFGSTEENGGLEKAHLILIAKDYEGYLSLCKIISEANQNLDKSKNPIITEENLRKHVKKGHLICTTACIAGPFGRLFGLEKINHEQKAAELKEVIDKSGYQEIMRVVTEYENLKREYKETKPLVREKTDAEKQLKKYGNDAGLRLIERREAKAATLLEEIERKTPEYEENLQKLSELKKARISVKLTKYEEHMKALERINRDIANGENEMEAHRLFEFFHDTFGENDFYFEIQNHGLEAEKQIYNNVIQFALRENHPHFIASNDIHIGVQKTDPNYEIALQRRNVIKYTRWNQYQKETEDDREYCIKDDNELREELLKIITDHEGPTGVITAEEIIDSAIGNIEHTLSQCHVEFPKHENHYPKFCDDENAEFEKKVREGIRLKFPNGFPAGKEEEYSKRLEYELGVIKQMGYAGYHLIVADYLQYGRLLGYLQSQEEVDNAPLSIEELDAYITKKGYSRVGYAIGPGRGCAIPGTKILTKNGYKNIETINSNDVVYDFTGRLSNVIRRWEYQVKEPMLEITVWNGGKLTYTKDHKFYSAPAIPETNRTKLAQGYRYLDNSPETMFSWKKAEDLHVGDWLALPKIKLSQNESMPKYDLAQFVNKKWIIDSNKLYYYNTDELILRGVNLSKLAKELHISKNTLHAYYYDNMPISDETIKTINCYLMDKGLTINEWKNLAKKITIPRYIECDSNFAYLVGYYIADGWTHGTECCFAYNKETEIQYRNTLINCIHSILGPDVSIGELTNKSKANTISIYCKPFADFMKNFIPGIASTKMINTDLLSTSDDILSFLLKGLFDGDGSYAEKYRAKYSTCNPQLAYQIKQILVHFGIASVVRRYTRKQINWKNEWVVSFTTSNRAIEILENLVPSSRTTNNIVTTADDNYIYMRIKSINEVDYMGPVYDLSVDTPNEPSYCTDVCAVHNSGAGSLCCYALGITDVDPIPYNLLFERFLNVERVSMPDIDSDFKITNRAKVVEYCKARYGADCICQIMTKSYGATKGNLRLAARYLGSKQFQEGLDNHSIDIDKLLGKATSEDMVQSEETEEDITLSKYTTGELNTALNVYMKEFYNRADKLAKDYDALGEMPELSSLSAEEQEIASLAKTLDGVFTGYGQHAAGTIISGDTLSDILPLMWNDKKGNMETQCTMAQAESKGLLKMDFLGLENLDMITEIMQHNVSGKVDDTLQDYAKRDAVLKDPAIFRDIFCTGMTQGIFQFESDGMKKMLRDFQPESFEDIILLVSAYRPGPMDYIPEIVAQKWFDKFHGDYEKYSAKIKEIYPFSEETYINKKEKGLAYFYDENGNVLPYVPHSIDVENDTLKEILKSTYGCPIYQEQIMQICQQCAGFSLGEADNVRRAMSKKKEELLISYRKYFVDGGQKENAKGETIQIPGCEHCGMTKDQGNKLFDALMPFAKYGFNKSHATAYAMVAMFTAYQKRYFTADFFRVALDHAPNLEKIPPFVKEMPYFGINFKGPSMQSQNQFTVEDAGKSIRYGLHAIKGFSEQNITPARTIESFIGLNPEISATLLKQYAKLGMFEGAWNADLAFGRGKNNRHIHLQWIEENYKLFEDLKKQQSKYEDITTELRNAKITYDKSIDASEKAELLKVINKLSKQAETWKNKIDESYILIDAKRDDDLSTKVKSESIQEKIENRQWESDMLSIPFDIEDSMWKLQEYAKIETNGIHKNTFDCLKMNQPHKTVMVPAIVLSCSKEKKTKKGKPYYDINLMDRNGSIITRRFDAPLNMLDGVFELTIDECKYWNCSNGNTQKIPVQERNQTLSNHYLHNNSQMKSSERVDFMREGNCSMDIRNIKGKKVFHSQKEAQTDIDSTAHVIDDEIFEK